MQRIRAIKKNQSGFTLIELLIVIVILGVLAAVVVFAVSAFNNKGKAAACQSDFKSIETADEAYYANNTANTNPPQYAGNINQLVPTYLKDVPGNASIYSFVFNTTTGVQVKVGNAQGDISVCGNLN